MMYRKIHFVFYFQACSAVDRGECFRSEVCERKWIFFLFILDLKREEEKKMQWVGNWKEIVVLVCATKSRQSESYIGFSWLRRGGYIRQTDENQFRLYLTIIYRFFCLGYMFECELPTRM